MTRTKWIAILTVGPLMILAAAMFLARDRSDHTSTSPQVTAQSPSPAPAATTAPTTPAAACGHLTKPLSASFVLVDDDAKAGEELFPRVTVRNRGNAAVDYQVVGVGSATSNLVGGTSVTWDGHSSSRWTVAAHGHRASDLGKNNGETLLVGPGQHVIKAELHALASSKDRTTTGCRIRVQRSSLVTTTICRTADKQHPGPFTGDWLSVEHRGKFPQEARIVQEQLNAMGYHCTPADGDYGTETARLVQHFQRDHGLATSGEVGPETWAALFGYPAPQRPDVTSSPVPAVPAPESTAEAPTPDVPDEAPISDFDRAFGVKTAGEIVEDIRTVDHRLGDGIGVPSALMLLSDSYGRLADAGTPPGVAAADYQSRVSTLQSFASIAADMYEMDPMQGSARYSVVRHETGSLFQHLNTALGTHFALP
jgi:hypothetical protein